MDIRDAATTDAQTLLELMRTIDSQTDYMLFEEEERSSSAERQERVLESVEKNPRLNLLVAEEEGVLLGYLALTQLEQSRVRHCAKLVCGVTQSAWGKGIGGRLMIAGIERAKALEVTRIELTVVTDNKRATNLYEKHGFKVEGVRRGSLRVQDRFYDEYYMALSLVGEGA